MTPLVARILIDGTLMSAAASALIYGSARANPRLWLQDLPRDIQQAVPPKTADEKRQSIVWGIPFLAVLVGAPVFSCIALRSTIDAGFVTLWLDAFGVMLFFNLYDLVIIDWLVVCWMTPSFFVIPGTAGLAGYKDYGHHFRGFLIGTTGCAIMAAVIAAAMSL